MTDVKIQSVTTETQLAGTRLGATDAVREIQGGASRTQVGEAVREVQGGAGRLFTYGVVREVQRSGTSVSLTCADLTDLRLETGVVASGAATANWFSSPVAYAVSAALATLPALPFFTVSPTLTVPDTSAGSVWTANAGTHNGSSVAYQWYRDGVAISGATSSTYTIVSGDVSTFIKCKVTITASSVSSFEYTNIVQAGISARYWRVRAPTTNIAGNYMGCTELQMRATSGGADQTTGKTAAASAGGGANAPMYAIDDNTTTFWTTNVASPPTGGHWLSVDFGTPVLVMQVSYQVRSDVYREDPASLVIEYSSDNTAWSTAWTASSIGTWTAGETKVFTKP